MIISEDIKQVTLAPVNHHSHFHHHPPQVTTKIPPLQSPKFHHLHHRYYDVHHRHHEISPTAQKNTNTSVIKSTIIVSSIKNHL
jgi:hypothetical protein